MIQEAEAYSVQKLAQAEGDVANFNAVYEKYILAKDVTKTRLKIEAMEKILSSTKHKYIIDVDGNGTVKYLPLNELNGKGN